MEPQSLLLHGNAERFCIPDSDVWTNCGQRIVEFLWQLWSCGHATMLRGLLILFLYDFENAKKTPDLFVM
jgi:hypothetical protein